MQELRIKREEKTIRFKKIKNWFQLRQRGVGQWAFALHRITGVALFGYLILHIETISSVVNGEEAYNATVRSLYNPFGLLVLSLVFGAGIFHGGNGLRIILAQFDFGGRHHKQLFWAFMAMGGIVLAYSIYLTVALFLLGEI